MFPIAIGSHHCCNYESYINPSHLVDLDLDRVHVEIVID
jgi:hypothetical protein